jgi:hypothetical protein
MMREKRPIVATYALDQRPEIYAWRGGAIQANMPQNFYPEEPTCFD